MGPALASALAGDGGAALASVSEPLGTWWVTGTLEETLGAWGGEHFLPFFQELDAFLAGGPLVSWLEGWGSSLFGFPGPLGQLRRSLLA